MLPPWSFSAWGDLPPEVAAAVFSRLLPRRGRWRWALYLSFGGEEETDGDFEAAAAVNLVCSSWHKSLGAAVTFLSPTFSSGATYKSLPGAELAARFPNLETLLAPGAEVGGGLAELQPLTALRELDLRTPRLQRRNLQDLRPLTSLTRLTLAAVEDRPLSLPRAGLLQALAPLTGLRQLDIDILALDNTTAASLRHFTNLEYLSVGQLQAKTSLRALQALPNLIGLSLPCTTPGSAIVDLLPLTRLQFLSLNSNCDFTCQDVALLTTLKNLCLEDCKLDTDDLLELRPLTNLTALSLSMNEAITDVSSLEVQTQMTCLNLRALFVPDSTLALLAARLTNLTSLDISNEDSHVENQLGPEASMMDLRALCLFASLQHVTVHNPKPDTIDSIAQLSSLKDLELHFWSSPGMEDDGLECLSRLAALNSLLIVHQSLSCASELPSQMEQLISDLPQASDCRPQYTEAALQRFLVALPHLKRCKAQSFLGDRLLLKRRF